MANVKIKAQRTDNEKQLFYGASNESGYYEIKVPAGNYLVTPILESNLTFEKRYSEENKPLKIEDKRCESKIFWVSNDSELSGKVIDSDGKSASGFSLSLITADKERKGKNFDYELGYVSEDGTFSFKSVPLGRYQISLNFTGKPDDKTPFPTVFYPSTKLRTQAKVFEIDYGRKIRDIVFQLPPKLAKRKIYGAVVWKNGKPAVCAEVQLRDIESDRDVFFNEPITDAKGAFSMEWFEGRQYKIKVVVWKKSSDGQSGFGIGEAESKVFTLSDKMQNFRIVLNTINPDEKSITRKTVRAN